MATTHPMRQGTYTTSSGYGPRWGTNHNGIDFAAPLGTPIYATEDGTIIQGRDRNPGSVGGFGNWIWQDSQRECGRDFIYGHMRHADIYVKAGDRVKAGQMIARVGSEGTSTGPHLHFEEWTPPGRTGGRPVDPAPRLRNALNPGDAPAPPQPPAPAKTLPAGAKGRDYYTLQPDKVHLLDRHYTRGRAGQRIQFVTRHHLMYIGEVEDVVDKIWRTRQASAHIVIGPTGRVGQAVWDSNTAWANASQWANQRTLAIEHSNITGRVHGNDFHPDSWNISDETIISGARWAAATCYHEKLGVPEYGKNIRDHFEFTATGCPVHLQGPKTGNAWGGKAGKYHNEWMEEAVAFYHQLAQKQVNPDGSPLTLTVPKEANMSSTILGGVSAAALNDAKNYAKDAARDAADIREQLRGQNDQGWEQLGQNEHGQNLTLVDAVAAIRHDIAAVSRKIDQLGGK